MGPVKILMLSALLAVGCASPQPPDTPQGPPAAPSAPSEAHTTRRGVVALLKAEEGFRAKPYLDSRGTLTIGFGTSLANGITEAEGEWLLRERLRATEDCVSDGWEPFEAQPVRIQQAPARRLI